MCRAFPTTLKGPARVWFSKIPLNTVSSFEELSKLFVKNFIGGQRHKRSSSSLLTIKQRQNESLRSFITRFNREALIVDEIDDKLLLAAFHNELILIYLSISFMNKSLKPWPNSSIYPRTS